MPSRAARRKRQRRPKSRRALAFLVLVALVAGGGYGYLTYVRDDAGDDAGDQSAARRPGCPTVAATPPPVIPAPAAVTVRLLNGTPRDGLAASVGADFVLRGFTVGATANAPARNTGPTRVSAAEGTRPAAILVAAQVPGAELAADPAVPAGTVDLVLGDTFTQLRTPAEAAASLAAATAATTPPPGC